MKTIERGSWHDLKNYQKSNFLWIPLPVRKPRIICYWEMNIKNWSLRSDFRNSDPIHTNISASAMTPVEFTKTDAHLRMQRVANLHWSVISPGEDSRLTLHFTGWELVFFSSVCSRWALFTADDQTVSSCLFHNNVRKLTLLFIGVVSLSFL